MLHRDVLACRPACSPGADVYTWPCGDGSKLNEDWVISASSIQSMQTPATCLAVGRFVAAGC